MRSRLVFSEALRSIGANLSTTVAATMTVLIAMFLLGLTLSLWSWANAWSDQQERKLLAKIYFFPDATPQQINAVRVKLETDPRVRKPFAFITEEEALKRMRRRYPDLVANLSSNPLPASYEVKAVRGELLDDIARDFKPLPPGVEEVDDGGKVSDRILTVVNALRAVGLIAVGILVITGVLLIGNTIRLSIFSRRREIEVMKLVGATNWFVRGPFMLEGLITGLVGAVGAAILLFLGKELLLPVIPGWSGERSSVEAMPFVVNAMIITFVGLILGAAGSGITLRRFLQV
jgi:cell division transport system permease protein